LREVRFVPLQNDQSADVATITLSDGSSMNLFLSNFYCEKSTIELRDFPKNCFYAAKDGENVKKLSYIETETVIWSVTDLKRAITFAYIPTRYQHLQPVLMPILAIFSIKNWFIGILILMGTLILTKIVAPTLLDVAKNKLKAVFEKSSDEKVGKRIPFE
jgi:hypothetical protein